MDSELEEATRKLAWLDFACARGDLDSCAALLTELKLKMSLQRALFALFNLGLTRIGGNYAMAGLRCVSRRQYADDIPASFQVLLTKLPSLPPSFEKTPNAVEELKIARAIYENAVILSLKIKDREAFERSLCPLKEFYINTCGIIAPSRDEYPFLGLNLLRLLAENRIAEFHTELELLPLEALNHPCIKYAVELEQSLMEQPEWEIKNCSVHFHMAKPKPQMDLASFKLIKQALSYARELELIV
ncbi:26S proteasome non-ATPase regulatory subunit 8-like protein A [Dichanthelium oligosanthes]|uniref:26S proteasome non-ATPase regulatory subunit 8-like protein A n=1 Tax=Dichanthelium oligosanthes TaxID=888268 RepID=A0A1E5V399_9POAL|nr:26S proteasome non-ATPase regulatory subunit 8-like protein A [Dichanthelium oligosanthes]